MQIQSVSSNYKYQKNSLPAFRSASRCVFSKEKQIICNYTKFFRDDLDWSHFVELLSNKYRNEDNVNILNLACSDGSEPMTLMTILVRKLKNEANKFFPIHASDIDEKILSEANSCSYKINEEDLFKINMALGHYSDYFTMHKTSNPYFPYALHILPKYSGNIIFKQQDLIYSINDIQPRNNVILCRNVLPYLEISKRENFIDKLAEKLDSTSLLVIGSYDNGHNINGLLRSRGFRPYGLENVYCNS